MAEHADAEVIAAALSQALGRQGDTLRLSRATVAAVNAGLISLQRGDLDDDLDDGYPRLLFRAPVMGDDVVVALLGGAPVVLGVLGSAIEDDPSDVRTGGPINASNGSTSTYLSLLSEAFTFPPGVWTARCGVIANFTNNTANSGATGRFSLPSAGSATNVETATANNLFTLNHAQEFTGLSGNVTIGYEYRARNGGTATAGRWTLIVIAKRTA